MRVEDVTIVIVTWNAEQVVGRCLEQLRQQTIQPASIIVVDNASTDETASVVAQFPEVIWQRLAVNVGFAQANNLALPLCRTEWVALLNPDAFAHPDWLEHLLLAAGERNDVAAFGSTQFRDDGLLDGMGDAMHWSGLIWRREHGCPIKAVSRGDEPFAVFSVCAAAALYRRSVLERLGGFDADFFCYGEDVDLGFRMRLAGFGLVQVPKARVVHIGSALTGGRRSRFSVFYGQRNLFWIYVKNMPGWLFWVLLPMQLVMHVAQIARFCLAGHCATIWAAKGQSLLEVPKMWSKRRRIQSSRVAKPMEIWRVLDKRLFPKRCERS